MTTRDDVFHLLKETFSEWRKDKGVRLGASLSFYAVFSLPPLLLISVTIAGIFYGVEAAQGKIVEHVQVFLGAKTANLIQAIIKQISTELTGFPGKFGAIAFLIGATAVFVDLQDALNIIWRVKPDPKSGFIDILRIRLLSLLLAAGSGLLLLSSLIASTVLSIILDYLVRIGSGYPEMKMLLRSGDFLFSFILMTLVFAILFKVLPDAWTSWRDIWPGAALTAFFFEIGKFLISMYLARSKINTVFGAAGSLAVLFLSVYYYAQIFFLGAAFTRVRADRFGSKTRPKKHAMTISEME